MFKILTKDQFDALTPAQQDYYMEQKKLHDDKEATERAEKAAKEAMESMKADLQREQKELLDKLKKENQEALEEQAKANGLKMEELEAALKRNKIADINNRLKCFSEHIIDKLSTEEGEKMIKDFFAGQRERLNFEVDANTLGKAVTVPALSVAPEFLPIVGPGHDDIHARNAIPVFPTTADLVKFLQFTYTGQNAGFATVSPGAQKPTLLYTSALKEAPVRKIAGLLDIPDEIMDDVAGFRQWIAYELPKAYLDAEDLQIFKGDGTGTNILGLYTQASNQTLPLGSVTYASNEWDKLMAGITEVRQLKRSTSAVFVSPVVYMELYINKGTTKEYTYPVVMGDNGVLYVGGVPIYWSNVFTGLEGLVGDYARGASIHQRMATKIDYSSENKDNFEKNIVTIRLEGRIALAIRVPEAFKRLTLQTT